MKKISKKQLIIVALILLIILFLLSPYLLIQIRLTGSKKITVNYGEKYSEPGYHANLLWKDITSDIYVSNNIKSEFGKYQVTYSYKFLFYTRKVKRTVQVKDVAGPKIVLTEGEIYETVINEPYQEPGFVAVDNKDGIVTDKVEVSGTVDITTLGEYQITYDVTDSSNNHTTVVRTVKVVRKNPMQMSVKEYSLDGWYDDAKLKQTQNYGDEYFNKITMVGDTNITNMYYNGLLTGIRTWTSPYLNATSLNTQYLTLYNYTIQTTLLDGVVMASPELMLLNFGTFSAGLKEEEFIESVTSIIEKIKKQSPDMKLMVSSIYPIGQGNNANNFTQETINRYNFLILEIADKYNIKFLDIASALKDNTGYGNPNYFTTDKIHLTYLGQSVVKEYIKTHAYVEE